MWNYVRKDVLLEIYFLVKLNMLGLYNLFCKKIKSAKTTEISKKSDSSSSSGTRQQDNSHMSYMFIRAEEPWAELNIKEYEHGNCDKILQEMYRTRTSRHIMFYDPTQKDRDPKFKIYDDLYSLRLSRAGLADSGISKNGAFILCFDEPAESVYAKIAAGNFHTAITEIINYKNYNFVLPTPKQRCTSSISTKPR